jgi:multicomponent Na+:H+ antiporter subunit E
VIRKVVILALAWVALTGDVSAWGVAFGIGLAAAAMAVAWPLGPYPIFPTARPLKLLGLLAYLAWQIVVANLKVAAAVLGPRRLLRPALVAVPLDAKSDEQITVLSNLISLTPGTLSLEVSPDRRTLFVHAMSVSSPDALRREIKDGFERRVIGAFP